VSDAGPKLAALRKAMDDMSTYYSLAHHPAAYWNLHYIRRRYGLHWHDLPCNWHCEIPDAPHPRLVLRALTLADL